MSVEEIMEETVAPVTDTECDRCHGHAGPFVAFVDDEPGDWSYCWPCAEAIVKDRWLRGRYTPEHVVAGIDQ